MQVIVSWRWTVRRWRTGTNSSTVFKRGRVNGSSWSWRGRGAGSHGPSRPSPTRSWILAPVLSAPWAGSGSTPPWVNWFTARWGSWTRLGTVARETIGTTTLILGFLGDLFTGNVSPRSLGSIVTIGEWSGQAAAAGPQMFLQFIALFSVNLAVLNLLPIPVLDGGHLLFLSIEAVRGKALTVEQRLRWSNVGFLIVMGIMIWALSNDFLRLFGL